MQICVIGLDERFTAGLVPGASSRSTDDKPVINRMMLTYTIIACVAFTRSWVPIGTCVFSKTLQTASFLKDRCDVDYVIGRRRPLSCLPVPSKLMEGSGQTSVSANAFAFIS
jgi:hypothetical protein